MKLSVRVPTSEVKALQKKAKAWDAPRAVPVPASANPKNPRQTRFSAQALIDKRAALNSRWLPFWCLLSIGLQVGVRPSAAASGAIAAHC
ncbi:hypothetical protein [Acidovorax sp. 59]|uniref:hypothetical protein n=1 Tax=Acidovorax sp. 59 TaxID=2035204 RepID=UPI001E5148F9|nr:hypothetical protein [Acidovorax sp. 59]